MLSVPLYYALLLSCWFYALLKGGAPERIGASILLAGSLLTLATVSERASSYASVETGVLVVDLATLLAFLGLAMRAERFWPLWVTAMQFMGTSGHLLKVLNPETIPRAYALAAIFWSYPMMLAIFVGVWRHQKRLQRDGVDRSWSISSARSAPKRRGSATTPTTTQP